MTNSELIDQLMVQLKKVEKLKIKLDAAQTAFNSCNRARQAVELQNDKFREALERIAEMYSGDTDTLTSARVAAMEALEGK